MKPSFLTKNLFVWIAIIVLISAALPVQPKVAHADHAPPCKTDGTELQVGGSDNGDSGTSGGTCVPNPPPTNPSSTKTPSLWSCLRSPATCTVQLVAIVMSSIVSLFVNLGAWMVDLALKFDTTILASPAISTGFGIMLALANLGFVLAVILIAIATILHWQEYELKKILWRVLVMAILVNFSLVLSGTVLKISDDMTTFFATQMTSGGISGVASGLATAFAPQTLNQATNPTDSSWQSLRAQNAQTATADADKFMATLLNLIVGIIFGLLMALVLIALAVLLLIRYAYITVLLVLMPVAWMLWVFPNFKHLFTKWWTKFWQWTFFPPITMFFLYVALFIKFNDTNYLQNNGVTSQAASGLGTITQSATVSTLSSSIIVIALTLGGLIAANAFGIQFANTAMGVTKKAGKWAGGYVGSRARRAATAPLRGARASAYATRLQQKTGILGLPGRYLGRGLQAVGANVARDELAAATKANAGKNPRQLADQMSTMTAPQRIDAWEKLIALGATGLIKDPDKYINDAEFKRYGKPLLGGDKDGDINKSLGSNKAMRDQQKLMGEEWNKMRNEMSEEDRKAGKEPPESDAFKETSKKFEEEMGKFFELLRKEDIAKANLFRTFQFSADPSKHDANASDEQRAAWKQANIYAKAAVKNLSLSSPQLLSTIASRMNSSGISEMETMFKSEFSDGTGLNYDEFLNVPAGKRKEYIQNEFLKGKKIAAPEGKVMNQWLGAFDKFRRIIANNTFGPATPGGGAPGGAPPPAPKP